MFTEFTLELPDLNVFTSKDNKGTTTYKVGKCEIQVSRDGCEISCIPTIDSCKSGLPLNSILKKFFPDISVKNLTKGSVLPGILNIESFEVNKCKGNINFTVHAKEAFDIIPDKIKVSKATLRVAFNYQNTPFTYASFGIIIEGTLSVKTLTEVLTLKAEKEANTTEFKFSIEAKKIKVSEFAQLFTKKAVTKNSPKSIENVTNMIINNPRISGLRNEDGFFEFVAHGKATGLKTIKSATVFLVIQKPVDSKVAVGFVAHLENLSPTAVISSVTGKNLSEVPLLKDLRLNFILEVSNDDIIAIKDAALNKELVKYISHGKTIREGAKLKVEFPLDTFKSQLPEGGKKKIPSKIYVEVLLDRSGIHFQFPEELKANLFNILINLSPLLLKLIPKSIFPNGPPNVEFRKFDVNIKTEEVDVALTAPGPITIGENFINISKVEFQLTKTKEKEDPWEFLIKAQTRIGDGILDVDIKKARKIGYVFHASIKSLTTKLLMKKFGVSLFAESRLENMEFFNFGIEDFDIKGTIGSHTLNLR